MAQMNQSQVKYVRQRAEQIYIEKQRTIRTEFTQPAVLLTGTQRIEALKSGRFEYKGNPDEGAPHQFFYNIRFIDETPQIITEGYQDALDELKINYTKLMDELILGDNEVALQLLKDFELDG